MPPFRSLKAITDLPGWQIGETAQLLHHLQRSGQSVPDSWVITTDLFQAAMQKLVAREPLYADWPQLLWQTASKTGYPVQHLAKRLKRPLLNQSSDFPWSQLLAEIQTPVVRLVPSLWFGDNIATAPFVEMVSAPLCWAEPEILEAALKQLWTSLLDAKSLAFWSQWRDHQPAVISNYPLQIAVAVIVQAVEPAAFSGTCTLRPNQIELAIVRGLPEAIAESCPDLYQGLLPNPPPFKWQPGYQEYSFTPQVSKPIAPPFTECYISESLAETAQEILDPAIEDHLWSAIKSVIAASQPPLKVGWSIAESTQTLQILQAYRWPMEPPAKLRVSLTAPALGIFGHAASPGRDSGLALILSADGPLPPTADHSIVVATEISPDWLPLLKTAKGIISEQGGLTCHAAVLARELGLPAIVGVANATQRFQTGDALYIDGDRGLIEPLAALPIDAGPVHAPPSLPIVPTKTKIWLNLSQPDRVEPLAKLPVAGVGLLRSEWLMLPLLDHRHPYHWLAQGEQEELKQRLLRQLRPILEGFAPRPVRYRTLDIRSNEFAQLVGAPPVESNPMLGIRGTFSYRQHLAFYQLELQVLQQLQEEGYDHLHLILPFVRTVEEIVFCREWVYAMGLPQSPNFELWMMAEVPSVLFSLAQYVTAGIQGIAIGTHDLTQLILGIDRDQSLFANHFDETHPAVQAAIAQLIRQARSLQIPCCLCGVSPLHHPDFVEAMLREGVTSIAVDASALAQTTQLVQAAESLFSNG
jgi:pyruvate,water dikinase